jgi:hypothetical protein
MAESEKPVLNDRHVYPSDDILFSIIGDKRGAWEKIMSYANENYNNITTEWRYYNDGKQWLFKMQMKKKTIFWVSILENTFRITFYYGDKAVPLIEGSRLPQSIKDGFRDAQRYGAIRPVTIKVTGVEDLENIFQLIDIKTKLK